MTDFSRPTWDGRSLREESESEKIFGIQVRVTEIRGYLRISVCVDVGVMRSFPLERSSSK